MSSEVSGTVLLLPLEPVGVDLNRNSALVDVDESFTIGACANEAATGRMTPPQQKPGVFIRLNNSIMKLKHGDVDPMLSRP
jgi:hypothetical protein